MLWLLVAVPAGSALLAFALPWNWLRRALLVAAAACPSWANRGLSSCSRPSR